MFKYRILITRQGKNTTQTIVWMGEVGVELTRKILALIKKHENFAKRISSSV